MYLDIRYISGAEKTVNQYMFISVREYQFKMQQKYS